MEEEARGAMDSRLDADLSTVVTRWYDNKKADMISSFAAVEPVDDFKSALCRSFRENPYPGLFSEWWVHSVLVGDPHNGVFTDLTPRASPYLWVPNRVDPTGQKLFPKCRADPTGQKRSPKWQSINTEFPCEEREKI